MMPNDAMRQADAKAAAIARAEKAERALRGAGWVDNGGEEWKPPLGAVPRSLLATLDAYRDDMERLRADHKHVSEQWHATSATLAAVCKALGCDVDSVQAQAAMFREKATTLLRERDAARAELAKWPSLIAEALSTRVGGRDIAPEEWAGHVRREHGAHTRTSSCLDAARAEVERLRGIKPGLPENIAPMARFGIRWNGPQSPIAVPMDDGYWTPWHVASAEVERLRKDLDDARKAAAEVDRAGGDAPHEPCMGLAAWIRCRGEMQRAAEARAVKAEAERDELRTEWFGIAGGENSFPSDHGGDCIAQQQVAAWLADGQAARAELEQLRTRAEVADRAASDAEGDGA